MTAGGNEPELYRYEAAHAFVNEARPVYDASAAKAGVGAHDGVPG